AGLVVRGNRIGTNAAGIAAIPNVVENIEVVSPSALTPAIVGGSGPGEGNLISGGPQDGMLVGSNVQIQGNLIGTDVTGTSTLANGWAGIHTTLDAANVIIGGPAPGSRNVISGNGSGIQLERSLGGFIVQGNYIGTDATGAPTLGNGEGIAASD